MTTYLDIPRVFSTYYFLKIFHRGICSTYFASAWSLLLEGSDYS